VGTSRSIDADFISPFSWGIGNKPADCQAYALAGVSRAHILLIDTSSTLRVWAEAEAGAKPGGAGAWSGSGAKSSNDLGAPGGAGRGEGEGATTAGQPSPRLPQTRSQASVHDLAHEQQQQQAADRPSTKQLPQGQQGQGVGGAGSFAGYRDPRLLLYLGVAPLPHPSGAGVELSATAVVRPLGLAMDDRI
jgi:hypothetical protein